MSPNPILEKTSVPAPRITLSDFSREILDRDYLIMEFLPGFSGRFEDAELGRHVREIHAIKGELFGYPERAAPTGQAWPALFSEYTGLILKDCLDCGIMEADEHAWFDEVYARNMGAVKDCEPCLLHLDLWTQNILTEDGRITAVLDFDRGLYGDPELEFAVLDTYGYSSAAFFNGYGQPRPDGSEAAVRQVLYIVYEFIKYAYIRNARGGSYGTGRHHLEQCQRLLGQLA
ncbi:phosphotransferase family protein [Planctomycetota bacterium]